jgi:DMSO/TMAO reductase YedYZ molybdopterin-dependent catalytic subunit
MKVAKGKRPVRIAEKTVSRRSVIEWLGKATVLALGGELVAACAKPDPLYPTLNAPGNSGIDARDHDARVDVDPSEQRYTFYPGDTDSSLFDRWPVRTVDAQQLTEILEQWRLIVDGLVEEPLTFSFSDLLELTASEQVTDFHCVEGWSVYDVPWNGVRFSEIFERVRPLPEATHLTFYSVGDVYLESIPIAIAKEPKTMLAYGIGGMTLPLRHGFPLRLVIPRLLAYKNAKYIYRVELSDKAVDGYWVKLGYPYDAIVPEGRLRQGKY